MSTEEKDLKQTANDAAKEVKNTVKDASQKVEAQAASSQQKFAKNEGNKDSSQKANFSHSRHNKKPHHNSNQNKAQPKAETKKPEPKAEPKKTQTRVQSAPAPKQKSGGTGLALLSLLVALGVGGAGYFFGSQKISNLEQQIASASSTASSAQQQAQQSQEQIKTVASAGDIEIPSFEKEKAEIKQLSDDYKQSLEKVAQLERSQTVYTQQIAQLQMQIEKVSGSPAASSKAWVLSDANFLLNNALQKMVLDNDIDTTKSLLEEADRVLSKSPDAKVLKVRSAIKSDLEKLATVNNIDQNALMVRLTNLANAVDDMPMLNNNKPLTEQAEQGDVSDSIDDWKSNMEKSADSFFSHFVRISSKTGSGEKMFVAPNQEVYLRENIRLRLQIAILAIPRQQDELYKQSLDSVASWVRSYFDDNNANVKKFLTEIESLEKESVYIDAPEKLESLDLLNSVLNKAAKPVQKVEIQEEKALPKEIEDKKAQAEQKKVEAEKKVAEPAKPAVEEKAPEAKPSEAKEAPKATEAEAAKTAEQPANDIINVEPEKLDLNIEESSSTAEGVVEKAQSTTQPVEAQ